MLLRNFIAVFIFLLTGYSQLFAHSSNITNSETKSIYNSENSRIKHSQTDNSVIVFCLTEKSDLPEFEKEEEEEEESVSFKKQLELANLPTSILFFQSQAIFSSTANVIFLHNKYFSYIFSCGYLALKVFRI